MTGGERVKALLRPLPGSVVPRLRRELTASRGAAAAELIRDPQQDACGIGMVYWRP